MQPSPVQSSLNPRPTSPPIPMPQPLRRPSLSPRGGSSGVQPDADDAVVVGPSTTGRPSGDFDPAVDHASGPWSADTDARRPPCPANAQPAWPRAGRTDPADAGQRAAGITDGARPLGTAKRADRRCRRAARAPPWICWRSGRSRQRRHCKSSGRRGSTSAIGVPNALPEAQRAWSPGRPPSTVGSTVAPQPVRHFHPMSPCPYPVVGGPGRRRRFLSPSPEQSRARRHLRSRRRSGQLSAVDSRRHSRRRPHRYWPPAYCPWHGRPRRTAGPSGSRRRSGDQRGRRLRARARPGRKHPARWTPGRSSWPGRGPRRRPHDAAPAAAAGGASGAGARAPPGGGDDVDALAQRLSRRCCAGSRTSSCWTGNGEETHRGVVSGC